MLDETTHKPTEYLYRDGEIYNMSGTKATDMDNVKPYLVHSKTDSQYILSQTVTTGTGEEEDEKKVTSYYELSITTTPATEAGGTATTTYALSNPLTYTTEHKIGAYTNPSFTLHQTETEETVIPETREAGTGTALSLTTTTTNTSNNNAPLSVDYTLTITNTSTGTVSTLTGRTDLERHGHQAVESADRRSVCHHHDHGGRHRERTEVLPCRRADGAGYGRERNRLYAGQRDFRRVRFAGRADDKTADDQEKWRHDLGGGIVRR